MNAQSLILLAQGDTGTSGSMSPLLLFVSVVALAFYFLILRPQKREQQQKEKLISGLSRGDKVISIGGLHGTVSNVSDKETVEVEIAKNLKVTFNRSAISVINPGKKAEDKKDEDKKEEKAKK